MIDFLRVLKKFGTLKFAKSQGFGEALCVDKAGNRAIINAMQYAVKQCGNQHRANGTKRVGEGVSPAAQYLMQPLPGGR